MSIVPNAKAEANLTASSALGVEVIASSKNLAELARAGESSDSVNRVGETGIVFVVLDSARLYTEESTQSLSCKCL